MRIVTVGRSDDNTVVIADEYVNDNHCRIVQHDNGYVYITDLNSTNGTLVNGLRVVGEVALGPHDTVRIGNTMLPWQSYFGEETAHESAPRDYYRREYQGGGYGREEQPRYQDQRPAKPDSYLVWAILATLFCCLPFGIVSIVYAAQVNNLWYRGDYEEAERSARNARTWFWWSFGLGLAAVIVWTVLMIAGVAADAIW